MPEIFKVGDDIGKTDKHGTPVRIGDIIQVYVDDEYGFAPALVWWNPEKAAVVAIGKFANGSHWEREALYFGIEGTRLGTAAENSELLVPAQKSLGHDVILTRDQVNTLLYLETRLVDHSGRVNGAQLNADDRAWIKQMVEHRFLQFGRIVLQDHNADGGEWVAFSTAAWTRAHAEREARAARGHKKRDYKTTEEASSRPPSVCKPAADKWYHVAE